MGESMRHSFILLAAASATALILSGCARNEAAEPKAAPLPQVSVAPVISRKVTEFDEFTGRFEAVERVEVRPRVSGYISSVNFKDGSEVKKGDVLFVIDPRPNVAERDKARAQLAQARSQLILARSERDRATRLLAQHAISQEEFDTRTSGLEQGQANVEAAQAALDAATLNLDFTRVTAPISGRISRALVTSGNFVTNGQTLLTTLVSLDPIYVSFDGDEKVYLKYTKLSRDGAQGARNPVQVGLADESGYPHQGVMVFVDNALDPATGTIVVNGLQRVRPGAQVQPQRVAMGEPPPGGERPVRMAGQEARPGMATSGEPPRGGERPVRMAGQEARPGMATSGEPPRGGERPVRMAGQEARPGMGASG